MLMFIVIAYLLILAYTVKYAARRSRVKSKPAATPAPVMDNLNALTALQQQRDIITDLISDIDLQLDAAPANREKLLKDKAALYSKLAMVEQRINKLIA